MSRPSELVSAGEVTIETYVDGQGGLDRPDVVVLPSYGRDGGADFDEFAATLAASGYRVLRPQPRGIAGSTGPMTEVTIDDLADDVATVIDVLSRSRAVVIGHAFGNFVARAVATNHPGQVAAIVLAAASGHTVAPEVNAAPFRAGNPNLPESERLAALRLAFFAPDHDPSAWLTGWYPRTLAMQHAAVTGIDLRRYWRGGSAPILELIAELDPFHQRPEWGDLRGECGDRVSTTVIAGASHALFPEQPEVVADAVLDYLDRLRRAR